MAKSTARRTWSLVTSGLAVILALVLAVGPGCASSKRERGSKSAQPASTAGAGQFSPWGVPGSNTAPGVNIAGAPGSAGAAPVFASPAVTGRSNPGVTRTAPLFAGLNKADITPPVGVPLAGYFGGARRINVTAAQSSNGTANNGTQGSGSLGQTIFQTVFNFVGNLISSKIGGNNNSNSAPPPSPGALFGQLLQNVASQVFTTQGGNMGLPGGAQNAIQNILNQVIQKISGPAASQSGSGSAATNGQYNTWMAPSTGVLDPIQARALVLTDGVDTVAFCTVDLVAVSNKLYREVHTRLTAKGILLPPANLILSGTGTHSGPGAFADKLLWQLLSMDDYKQPIMDHLAESIATAIFDANKKLTPAKLGFGKTANPSLTTNRRAPASQFLNATDIDPAILVMRVDDVNGAPLAVLYNFAVRPDRYGASNLQMSADLVRDASEQIETSTKATALFFNGAQGDAEPDPSWMSSSPAQLGQTLGQDVVAVWTGVITTDIVELETSSRAYNFQTGTLSLGPQQLAMITGLTQSQNNAYSQALNQAMLAIGQTGLASGAKLPLTSALIDTEFSFHGVRINKTLFLTVPGEAIRDVGLELKQVGKNAGFDETFVLGLTNGYMGYVTTDKEYREGGMEALLTLFDATTGKTVTDQAAANAQQIKP